VPVRLDDLEAVRFPTAPFKGRRLDGVPLLYLSRVVRRRTFLREHTAVACAIRAYLGNPEIAYELAVEHRLREENGQPHF
jgi:hypothetical protein